MGHEAAVTKKKVLDTVKAAIDRANECIRDTAEVQKTHNEFVRIVEGKIDDVRGIAHRASVWAEANEGSVKNVSVHLEGRMNTHVASLSKRIGDQVEVHQAFQELAIEQTKLLGEILDVLPPKGFFARLKWLCIGPSGPLPPDLRLMSLDGTMPMADEDHFV